MMTALPCPHCKVPEFVHVHEVFSNHEFMLDTCCEDMRDDVNEFLARDPKAAGAWLSGLSDGILGAIHGPGVRRVIESDGQFLVDWNLHQAPVAQLVAKEFVRKHHRHCPPPAGWRYGGAVSNGPGEEGLIGVVMIGRPVARALDQNTVVEVNRLCVRPDIPAALVWNACSLLYGWASREARKRGFKRIITYTLESEEGTSLRAAGWKPEAKTQGGSWSRPGRPRTDKTSTEPKVRWAPAWCALT